MNNKILILISKLKKLYPDAKCELNFSQPHELLIAVRLSAQCTDKRVNLVTQTLFKKFNSINSFANAEFNEIYEIIKPCGLGNKKTLDIINICKCLAQNFNLQIPNKIENLLTLPGVGRKTANLVLATLFNKPTIVVDTHVLKITNRLGIVTSKNPLKIENQLLQIIPPNERTSFCHRLVKFGKSLCSAKKPKCSLCPLTQFCTYKQL